MEPVNSAWESTAMIVLEINVSSNHAAMFYAEDALMKQSTRANVIIEGIVLDVIAIFTAEKSSRSTNSCFLSDQIDTGTLKLP